MEVESTPEATPAQGAAARRPIGEFLVERGLVTPEQLRTALAEQRKSGKRLGEILVERGAITRMALASVLGEQWEEAGRHLRAVVPVRLAGGKEADAGLAGGEELTESLASLQAAVARLEELSGGPLFGVEHVAGGSELGDIDTALAGLRDQLSELREAVAAPMVVESDLGERLAELDSYLRERTSDDSGTRLAEAVEAVGARVDAELGVVETRLAELAELVSRPADTQAADAVVAELAELRAAVERPAFDARPLEERLDALQASVGELRVPVAEAPTEELVLRLAALEESLGAVRAAVESPRDSGLDDLRTNLDALHASVDELRGAGGRTHEIADRLGRLEESVGHALARPDHDATGFDELAARLDGLRASIESLRDGDGADALAERLGTLESALRESRAADDSRVDEILGRLQELQATTPPADDARLDDVLARLEEVRSAVATPRDAELAERLGRLEAAVHEPRVPSDPRLDEVLARLHELQTTPAPPSHDGRLDEVLARLDAAAREPRVPSDPRLDEVLAVLHELQTTPAPPSQDSRLDEVLARLDDMRSALAAPGDAELVERVRGAVAEQLGRFEHVLHEAAQQSPVSLHGELLERLGRLEAAVHEAHVPSDPRLDEVLARLHELQTTPVPPSQDGRLDEVLARLDDMRSALAAPGDGELVERLARLEESLRQDTRLDDALGRLHELNGAIHTAREGELAVDVLRSTLAESDARADERAGRLEQALRELAERPTSDDALAELSGRLAHVVEVVGNRPDRSGEIVGLLRRLARESAVSSEELASLVASLALDENEAVGELSARDSRIAELTGLVDELRSRLPEPEDGRPRPGDHVDFLALLPVSGGYRLVTLAGPLPAQGEGIAVPDDDRALVVARVGRSPYPGDARLCAYLNAN